MFGCFFNYLTSNAQEAAMPPRLDAAVIGGAMVGAAIACGPARRGMSVVVPGEAQVGETGAKV